MRVLLWIIWSCIAVLIGVILGMVYKFPEYVSVDFFENELRKPKTSDYLNLEDRFHKLGGTPNLLVASIQFERGAGSAFAVKFRDRSFVLIAGHVVEDQQRYERLILKGRRNSLELREDFIVSFTNDIAAYEISEETLAVLGIKSGALYSPRNLVKEKTPLAIMCDPFGSSLYPVRVGFFAGYSNADNRLMIKFPGAGVVKGCSGGPVYDIDGRVLGLVVERQLESRYALAIPSQSIRHFLRHKFFNKAP